MNKPTNNKLWIPFEILKIEWKICEGVLFIAKCCDLMTTDANQWFHQPIDERVILCFISPPPAPPGSLIAPTRQCGPAKK